jgi:RNA 2',3'-cyclic 3'-phosphodiesterase
LRAFVAIEIPNPEVMNKLTAFQRELEGTRADLKTVERENLHYTVKFLGEITDVQAAEVDRRLRALNLPKADVTAKGVGAFPSPNRPRVVWVGVAEGDSQKMEAVAEPVIRSLKGIGEQDDRPFQAHLTLARVRSGLNKENLERLLKDRRDDTFGPFAIAEFKLKSSVLTPKGPIYSDVGVYRLN